jgi:hypothetical protein
MLSLHTHLKRKHPALQNLKSSLLWVIFAFRNQPTKKMWIPAEVRMRIHNIAFLKYEGKSCLQELNRMFSLGS